MKNKFDISSRAKAFDELFRSTNEESNSTNDIVEVEIDKLRPFPNHPFKIYEGEKLDKMVESIKQFGVITPIVIKTADNGYLIISGHNRTNAAKIAGIKTVKAILVDADDDEAALLVVESNFRQREAISISEKALAYKMKYDAMKRKGRRTDLSRDSLPSGPTRDIIGNETGENGKQIQRYLRVALLIPELLKLLDSGIIGLTPAVEISYLPEDEQKIVYQFLSENTKIKISFEQSKRIRALFNDGEFNPESLESLLLEKKDTSTTLKIKTHEFKSYLPPDISTEKEILTFIKNALEYYQKNR